MQHGFEVQPVLLAQLGGFFLQCRQRLGRLVLEGEHSHVAVGFGGHAQHALLKHLREPLQEKRVAFVATPPVGDENAVVAQGGAAVGKKRLSHQGVDNLHAVEAVHQQNIRAAAQGFDVFRAVGLDNFKFFALKRQFKQAARHADDLRVDFHRRLRHLGQVGIDPAHKRAAAQPDLRDVAHVFGKQEPGHHGAAVGEHQLGGVIHIHRALHRFAAQMQRADVAVFGNAHFGQGKTCRTQAAVGMTCHINKPLAKMRKAGILARFSGSLIPLPAAIGQNTAFRPRLPKYIVDSK